MTDEGRNVQIRKRRTPRVGDVKVVKVVIAL
jgi:hypothetical protein